MSSWTFLTNHAQVLLAIAADDRATAKEIAAVVGVTERAVQRIIDDLVTEGYISRFREGRKNRYEIQVAQGLRHPAQRGCTIREFLLALAVEKD
ncbi:MAG TPA: winged helix-turn-helix domain-containing protein [Thermomicrobiales bacterium]|jgi:predicted transcriptional regulator